MNFTARRYLVLFILSLCCLGRSHLAGGEIDIVLLGPGDANLYTEVYENYGLTDPFCGYYVDKGDYLLPAPPLGPGQVDFVEINQMVRKWHEAIGDLDIYSQAESDFFLPGAGSTHIFVALIYGLYQKIGGPMLIVDKLPAYPWRQHIEFLGLPGVRYQTYTNPSEIHLGDGETLVEIVVSPNNPDGATRSYNTNASIYIYDTVFAFDWYNFDVQTIRDQINELRSNGKTVYNFISMSKMLGRTGDRFGYMWLPRSDSELYQNMLSYWLFTCLGNGSTGVQSSLNLMKCLLKDNCYKRLLLKDVKASLLNRHCILTETIKKAFPNVLINSQAGPPFFWFKVPGINDPAKFFLENYGTIILDTTDALLPFEGEPGFARINVMGRSKMLYEFVKRLDPETNYTLDDFLCLSCKCKKQK